MKFPVFEPIDLKEGINSVEAVDLLLTKIIPNKDQPRKNFDENSLEELASSIKQHGIIQPILVRNIEGGNFQIIAGERRWRAAKIAGLDKIPAIIKDYNQSSRLAVSLIENIQRENLNPLEEAEAIQSLLSECNMTHTQVAESIGRSRTSVTNLLRLLALTPQVKAMINSGLLEMGHARALLSLDVEKQRELAQQIVIKSLSVRETERLVQKMRSLPVVHFVEENPYQSQIAKWQDVLAKKLSSSVKVQLNDKGEGKIIISVRSPEEIDWLIKNLR